MSTEPKQRRDIGRREQEDTMTDIIERLQAEIERTVTLDLLHQEAANEIASLRANITTMEAAARAAIEIVRKEKDAEILRLRVAHHEDTDSLHAEIARLQVRLCPECSGPVQWRCQTCKIAQAVAAADGWPSETIHRLEAMRAAMKYKP